MKPLARFTEADWQLTDGQYRLEFRRGRFARRVGGVQVMWRTADGALHTTSAGVTLADKDRTVIVTADIVFDGEVWV